MEVEAPILLSTLTYQTLTSKAKSMNNALHLVPTAAAIHDLHEIKLQYSIFPLLNTSEDFT